MNLEIRSVQLNISAIRLALLRSYHDRHHPAVKKKNPCPVNHDAAKKNISPAYQASFD